jgi:hypothetical protein
MILAIKTFGVNFVDILRAGRAGREPTALCDYFDAAYGRAIPRCVRQNREDFLTSQIVRVNVFFLNPFKIFLLLTACRCRNAVVNGVA